MDIHETRGDTRRAFPTHAQSTAEAALLLDLPDMTDEQLAVLYGRYLDGPGLPSWHLVFNEIQARGLTLDDIESLLVSQSH